MRLELLLGHPIRGESVGMELRLLLQRLRCHGLQREPTNRIRRHIVRPTAVQCVLVFPIPDWCAKMVNVLLLLLQHSVPQSTIRLFVGRLENFTKSPPSVQPWPLSQFLITVSASSRQKTPKQLAVVSVDPRQIGPPTAHELGRYLTVSNIDH